MKFTVGRPNSNYEAEVEINTLDDLLAFVKEAGHSVIISEPPYANEDKTKEIWDLEIYDDYRE